MPRRDLTALEIRELRLIARTQLPRAKDLIERVLGELEQLRDREANARYMAGLEGEY